MPSLNLDTLSPFGRLAVKLDVDFSEMARIGGQMQRLEIDSDSGLQHAIKLLSQFAQHGQNVAEGIQEFSKSLEDARQKAESAARIVEERAKAVQDRRQLQTQIEQKLGQVEQKVKTANASLAGFRKDKPQLSDEEKGQIKEGLEQLNSILAGFIEEARRVKEESNRLRFKSLEHDAQSLLAALQASQRKISLVVPAK